jgi:hypothetical protein
MKSDYWSMSVRRDIQVESLAQTTIQHLGEKRCNMIGLPPELESLPEKQLLI